MKQCLVEFFLAFQLSDPMEVVHIYLQNIANVEAQFHPVYLCIYICANTFTKKPTRLREGGGQPELCMISSLDSILHISILPSFGETFNFSHRNKQCFVRNQRLSKIWLEIVTITYSLGKSVLYWSGSIFLKWWQSAE